MFLQTQVLWKVLSWEMSFDSLNLLQKPWVEASLKIVLYGQWPTIMFFCFFGKAKYYKNPTCERPTTQVQEPSARLPPAWVMWVVTQRAHLREAPCKIRMGRGVHLREAPCKTGRGALVFLVVHGFGTWDLMQARHVYH